jgi:hypothetical protein
MYHIQYSSSVRKRKRDTGEKMLGLKRFMQGGAENMIIVP